MLPRCSACDVTVRVGLCGVRLCVSMWRSGYYNAFGSWAYIERMNIELGKMALRGLTVMAGAGR